MVYATATIDPDCTLEEFLIEALEGRMPSETADGLLESITVQEGDRLIYDPDFVDNGSRSLADLGLVDEHGTCLGRLVTVTDEDQIFVPVTFVLQRSVFFFFPFTTYHHPLSVRTLKCENMTLCAQCEENFGRKW